MRTIDRTALIALSSALVVSACVEVADVDPTTADPQAGVSALDRGPDPSSESDLESSMELTPTRAEAELVDGPAAACQGTSSPFSTGPRCCPRTTVLRPWLQRCEAFGGLSPARDAFGSYNGAADRPNWAPVGADTLQICAAYVSDNGEGTNWPHGPIGNLYVDTFGAGEPLDPSPDGADRRRIGQLRQLRGPHRTHDTTDEWLDDELQRYQQAGVFVWGGRSALVLRVWESDGSEDGSWGRRNDVLGMERIMRAPTLGGQWVALHSYTNAHPRRRTATVSGWLLLKTGGTCPR